MEEESRKSFAQITLYNQLIKEMDDLYRVYAKNCNLSETAFWIRTEKYDGGRSAYLAGGGRQPQE